MNRVIIDLHALQHNLRALSDLFDRHSASWSIVTKCLCGHLDTLRALTVMGARSMADSRLDNLTRIQEASPEVEKWYLRLPHLSVIPDVVRLSDVSLNTEIEVISAISREAVRQERIHNVMIMIELGDLREGILPSTLVGFYERVFNLPNIKLLGIGAQLGCLAGTIPNIDQIAQLLLYRELLELKFERKLPLVSAGSSIFLPLLIEGQMPRGVNHYRVGESLFLGTDLVNGGTLKGLRDDVVFVEGEIAEIKEKSLVPLGEPSSAAPFEVIEAPDDAQPSPGQRGYRALVTVGQLDTDVNGLTPTNPNHQIAAASSDVTVVNLGENPSGLRIGDTIRFRPNYGALVRLMNDPYIAKQVTPSVDDFALELGSDWNVELKPALEQL